MRYVQIKRRRHGYKGGLRMANLVMASVNIHQEDIREMFMLELQPYMEELRTYSIYTASSVVDGEDLYQEVLLKAYMYRMRITQEVSPFSKGYLFRMAQNVWIDMYRKHRGRVVLCEQVEYWETASNRYIEIRELVEHVADRVPERHVDMLLMLDVFRYSMEEIANIRNISVAAVKSTLHRTRSKLRMDQSFRGSKRRDRAKVERWVDAVMQGDPSGMMVHVAQG